MEQVIIHMKESAFDHVKQLGHFWVWGNGEIDVILPDVDFDSLTEDPDVLLCDHYGINYDLVNCIELC